MKKVGISRPQWHYRTLYYKINATGATFRTVICHETNCAEQKVEDTLNQYKYKDEGNELYKSTLYILYAA